MPEDATWFVPFIESRTSEKLPWAATTALHSFEEFPPMEACGNLTAAYAGQSTEA